LRNHSLRAAAVTIAFAACSGNPTGLVVDGGTDTVGVDAGITDAGITDAGITDAGVTDAAVTDAGITDAGDTEPVEFTQGTSTLAGRAFPGDVDGARSVARFANPVNVAYRDGRVYVADFDNNKIRVVDAATHETTTLIAQAGFQRPFGLAFASDGTLYISTDNDQSGGHSAMSGSIWKVAAGAQTAVLVAGSIGRPRGLAVLSDGRIAATDYVHHVVELIAQDTGTVTLLAGAWDQPGFVDDTGATARFSSPYGVAVRGDGTLVVADFDNQRIRLVTLAGVASTLSGSGAPGFQDGDIDTAMFRQPQGIAIADDGDIFISEPGNNRIRRITSTAVQTVAGNGVADYLDEDDPLASELYGLEGLAVVPDGSMLYVADGARGEAVPYNRIRQVAKHW
jgi:YVTN family beta-propeller protein